MAEKRQGQGQDRRQAAKEAVKKVEQAQKDLRKAVEKREGKQDRA